MQLTLVLALLFALAVAGFAVQNAEPITVRFLQWESRTSLVVVILGAAVVGALSAGLAGAFRQLRIGLRVRNLQGQTHRLEQEVEQLRSDRLSLQAEIERLRRQLDAVQRPSRAAAAPEPRHLPGSGPASESGTPPPSEVPPAPRAE